LTTGPELDLAVSGDWIDQCARPCCTVIVGRAEIDVRADAIVDLGGPESLDRDSSNYGKLWLRPLKSGYGLNVNVTVDRRVKDPLVPVIVTTYDPATLELQVNLAVAGEGGNVTLVGLTA
jgi:hypothetical protein